VLGQLPLDVVALAGETGHSLPGVVRAWPAVAVSARRPGRLIVTVVVTQHDCIFTTPAAVDYVKGVIVEEFQDKLGMTPALELKEYRQ
jgi:hypothetical protein